VAKGAKAARETIGAKFSYGTRRTERTKRAEGMTLEAAGNKRRTERAKGAKVARTKVK
jgi:hypothetical protein